MLCHGRHLRVVLSVQLIYSAGFFVVVVEGETTDCAICIARKGTPEKNRKGKNYNTTYYTKLKE